MATKPDGFVLRAYNVTVNGQSHIYFAKTPARARANAWSDYAGIYDVSFRDFLRCSSIRRAARFDEQCSRYGEALTICGEPAFYVSHNSQYIQFVRPGSDVVLHSHPLDVEPPEARRGTPYYVPSTPETR